MKHYHTLPAIIGGLLILNACSSHDDKSSTDSAVTSAPTQSVDTPTISQEDLYKTAIESILGQDVAASKAGSYPRIVMAMRNIDISPAPQDFRVAYEQHTQAWEHRSKLQDQWNNLTSDDHEKQVLGWGIVCGLFSCPNNPIDSQVDIENAMKQLKAEDDEAISNTYDIVKQAAAKYGAHIPAS